MINKIIALILLSTIANAATTGSITLSGIVPKIVSISITGQGVYNNLDLSTTATNLLVANVTEASNDINGYSVTVASANAGLLKNGAFQLAYTAKYNNTTFTLSATPVVVTSVASQVAVVNVTKPVVISYTGTGAALMMSGTYSDTLTFNITAN